MIGRNPDTHAISTGNLKFTLELANPALMIENCRSCETLRGGGRSLAVRGVEAWRRSCYMQHECMHAIALKTHASPDPHPLPAWAVIYTS
ncbi:hypothetical protein TgHK011_005920 [Trichoderma gracile]|nr:hypothetical protein TgHK011_005920 [Trichoderma gracile]